MSVLASRLAADASGREIECVNAGISGGKSPLVVEFLREHLLALEPDLVVVDLSSNDTDPEVFEAALEEMVLLHRERGIETLFVLEPNGAEPHPYPLPLHPVMRGVAFEHDVPLVDVHAELVERADTG